MAGRGTLIPSVLTSVGVAGLTGVSVHVLLTHGSGLMAPGPLSELDIPLAAAAGAGVAVAAVMSRLGGSQTRGPVETCTSCGATLHPGWRLCPECGYMPEGTK